MVRGRLRTGLHVRLPAWRISERVACGVSTFYAGDVARYQVSEGAVLAVFDGKGTRFRLGCPRRVGSRWRTSPSPTSRRRVPRVAQVPPGAGSSALDEREVARSLSRRGCVPLPLQGWPVNASRVKWPSHTPQGASITAQRLWRLCSARQEAGTFRLGFRCLHRREVETC